MTLLSFNLIIMFVLCNKEGDLDWCEKALDEQLALYPDGIWFLMLKARLELTKGNIEDSIEWYEKSWKSQQVWPHFHHICFWELMWAHCIQQEWRKALQYAEKLSKHSKWSRTIYLYQQAAIMIMMKPSLSSEEHLVINQLMMQAPTYKQRIAGKSLPMEKFVIKKTERYFAQKNNLILPIFELMYIYNLFTIMGKRKNNLMSVLKIIEEEEYALFENKP
jgi:tetratricopeptide (TPR) repeat protein